MISIAVLLGFLLRIQSITPSSQVAEIIQAIQSTTTISTTMPPAKPVVNHGCDINPTSTPQQFMTVTHDGMFVCGAPMHQAVINE